MIYGARGLPWITWKRRESPGSVEHLFDCGRCQERYTPAQRQLMGCGWEPPIEGATTWWPRDGLDDEPPDTCIGYLIRLPEVSEAARAFVHWERGTLNERFGGLPPTTGLLDVLEALHNSGKELDSYIARPKEK